MKRGRPSLPLNALVSAGLHAAIAMHAAAQQPSTDPKECQPMPIAITPETAAEASTMPTPRPIDEIAPEPHSGPSTAALWCSGLVRSPADAAANAPTVDDEVDAADCANIVGRGLLAPIGRRAVFDELQADEDAEGAEDGLLVRRLGLARIIGARIVALRTLDGMPQGQMARRLGFRKSAQVSQWEAGTRLAPITRLVELADLFGVSLDYLLGRSDEPERNESTRRRMSTVRAVKATIVASVERVADLLDERAIFGSVLGTGQLRDLLHEAGRVVQRGPGFDDLEVAARRVEVALQALDRQDAELCETLARVARAG